MKTRIFIILIAMLIILPVLATQVKPGYSNQPPIASFTYSPTIPAPEETITFNASASYDPDGWITQYTWNFGDGNILTATIPTITYAYPVDGNYTVELTVTDNSGSTGVASAVVPVNCVVFFRVVILGTLTPVSNVKVTAFYNNGSAWVKAPAGPNGIEIMYDNMTQPNLANTNEQKYRNPGYTASILRSGASNIGFDFHQANWNVFFKFEWGSYVAYWPNETTRVYSYKKGVIEPHDYNSGHQAHWDPTASTYVIRAGDIAGNGVSPTDSHPIIAGIMCPPPTQNYYLTVRTDPSGITTIPGQGWYVSGTDATLTAPQYVDVSANTRYRFNYWDVDGTSKGIGVNPITVRMNANHTATAHYVLQYTVIFNQTGLTSDATGTVLTVNGSSKAYGDLPYTFWVDTGSTVTYSYSSPVSSSISGKQFRRNSISGPTSPVTVTGPTTVTGNYVVQYLVTFAQTGLDSTATGTVVTVNGTAKTYSDLSYGWWVDTGSTVTYSYSSTVLSTVSGKQFRLTGVNCPPSQFVVTAPVTITGSYCVQYKITFTHTGLDSTAAGTIVTINGTSKTYAELPFGAWIDSGSSVTYSYTSPVLSSYADKRFRLNSVTGLTSPFTVTNAITITGNYVVQYKLIFTHTGLDYTSTGTVVTVGGSAKVYGDLPFTLWTDSGSSVTYSYTTPVSSNVTGKRFRLNSVTGPSSPITVSGSSTVTGNYVTQYLVTLTHTGLDSSATGTVVTVNSSAKTYGDLPYSLWTDSGSIVSYSYNSPVSSNTSGKQFRLNTISGPASPITVTGSTTVTGNYVVQYLVTFAQTGLDSTATGTVVTVNGTAKTYSDLSYGWWVDTGSTVTYSYNDIVLSTVAGKRFNKTSVTGLTSPITTTSAVTVTGNYKIQYQVTFSQTGVSPDFNGTIVAIDGNNYNYGSLAVQFWLDKDSSHNFSFASPLTVNSSKQYVWSSTSGLSNLQSGTLTVTTSGNIVGNYMMLNCVMFAQLGVGGDFNGTTLIVDGTPYNVLPQSFMWQLGTNHTFAYQSPLEVTPNTKRYVWTSTTGLSNLQSGSMTVTTFGSIIGNYKTQYYLNLPTNPPGVTTPSGSGWYDTGTFANISTDQYVYGGSRWRFAGWTTDDMSEITDPSSPSTTVLIDKSKIVLAGYIHQHLVTFFQTGLGGDATGNVTIVDGWPVTYSGFPYAVWVDQGDTISYSYEPIVSAGSGKRYALANVTGPVSPITPSSDVNVTGNYKTQYYLTVSSPYGTTSGQGWYDSGTTAYASVNANIFDQGNGTRRVFTYWNGDSSGTNYAQSDPITMNGPRTAVANWKTQYRVIFDQLGLDSSASSTVMTVNSIPKVFGDLPCTIWVDSGGMATYSYTSPVSSITSGKRFMLTGISGPTSPITVTSPVTVTGDYKIQYQITFGQTGILSDFTGTIVTIDGTTYTQNMLPNSSWWDNGSPHQFAFSSPLVVNISRQYVWTSTTGLSTLQNGTITVTGSGSVTGNYDARIKYQITFSQTGVGPEFLGTIMFVDEINVPVLPATFWWDAASVHTFAYQSPLPATSGKRYVWTSTSGPWPLQNGSITITTDANVTGNYKTQYYLTLATNPSSITSPSGEGWYDAGSNATISTAAFVTIVPGSSRYRFDGWSTANMTEISDPARSPTTVIMDEAKTVTANYAIQYYVAFYQAGINGDFGGTIVTIDSRDYNNTSMLNATFWWDNGSIHTFSFASPLVVNASKQYVWSSTTGLTTLQSGSLTVSTYGNVTGHYNSVVTYALTIITTTGGTTNPAPGTHTHTAGTTVQVTGLPDMNYLFDHWELDGNPSTANPISIYMGGDHTLKAFFKPIPLPPSVTISPPSATINLGYSVLFTSFPTGGVPPYSYQWHVNGNPVPGATSATFSFKPMSTGTHYVYLKVTDTNGNSTQSTTSTVYVIPFPTGGYSVSMAQPFPTMILAIYVALTFMSATVLSLTKRKRK